MFNRRDESIMYLDEADSAWVDGSAYVSVHSLFLSTGLNAGILTRPLEVEGSLSAIIDI